MSKTGKRWSKEDTESLLFYLKDNNFACAAEKFERSENAISLKFSELTQEYSDTLLLSYVHLPLDKSKKRYENLKEKQRMSKNKKLLEKEISESRKNVTSSSSSSDSEEKNLNPEEIFKKYHNEESINKLECYDEVMKLLKKTIDKNIALNEENIKNMQEMNENLINLNNLVLSLSNL
jgi:hypothetical protein